MTDANGHPNGGFGDRPVEAVSWSDSCTGEVCRGGLGIELGIVQRGCKNHQGPLQEAQLIIQGVLRAIVLRRPSLKYHRLR